MLSDDYIIGGENYESVEITPFGCFWCGGCSGCEGCSGCKASGGKKT